MEDVKVMLVVCMRQEWEQKHRSVRQVLLQRARYVSLEIPGKAAEKRYSFVGANRIRSGSSLVLRQ